MKLKCEFVVSEIADELVAVPVGKEAKSFHLVMKLNEESKKILELLNHETTVEEISSKIRKEYDVDDDTLKKYINEFVDQLRDYQLIEG